MMNLMITGHKGFVGKAVKQHLIKEDFKVFGFDLPEHDFTNEKTVNNFIETNRIEMILHIGAVAGLAHCMEHPDEAIKANIYGTSILLKVAHKKRIRFIHTSTWAVNGKLEHPYDITKKISEELVMTYNKIYGLETMILRLATMYGLGQRKNGVVWAFLEKSMKNEKITIQGDGNQFRQFLYIDDAAKAFYHSIINFESGLICEIQAPERITINQIAEIAYNGKKEMIEHAPKRKSDEESFFIEPDTQIGWVAQTNFVQGIEKMRKLIQNDL